MIGWRHTVEYRSFKLPFILYVILRPHNLIWDIISVSEKRMQNCIVKIIDNVFGKNDEVSYFP